MNCEEILDNLAKDKFNVFLLQEADRRERVKFYIELLKIVRSLKKASIFLVPQVSLVEYLSRKMKDVLKEDVAIFYSQLAKREALKQWERIRKGETSILLGTRSSVFAPLKDLRLIIVEDEESLHYKQQETPRYDAVKVALERAKMASCLVLLGSSCPSFESYYSVRKKRFKLIQLKTTKKRKPLIKILDLKRARKRGTLFSLYLEEVIDRALEKKERIVLFLNRRGFATYGSCKNCGFVLRCERCQFSLMYQFGSKFLICRYCNYKMKPPEICPNCGSSYIRYFGFGTQKLESQLHRFFPQARIARIDKDVKEEKRQLILKDFKRNNLDLLIATGILFSYEYQLPKVDLMGIISVDRALNLPDFRAAENTYRLLLKLANKTRGQMIIQSYVPEHYCFQMLMKSDFDGFFKKEMAYRKELNLPPFKRLALITVRAKKEGRAKKVSQELLDELKSINILGFEISGPTPAYKLRGNYRWEILIRGKNFKKLKPFILKFKSKSRATITVDVDPR